MWPSNASVLPDEAIVDAIYDNQAIRAFVGIDLSRESAPSAMTLLNKTLPGNNSGA
jgi:hypothetical protein